MVRNAMADMRDTGYRIHCARIIAREIKTAWRIAGRCASVILIRVMAYIIK